MRSRRTTTAGRAAASVLALGALACGGSDPALPRGDYSPRPFPELHVPRARAAARREELLARARVWAPPAVPVERADLGHRAHPAGGLPDEIACRYLEHQTEGTTPKVHCVMAGGEILKIKFGPDNAERFAELAASWLAQALGFGADEMSYASVVHCIGCPEGGASWTDRLLRRAAVVDFRSVSVERRHPGKEVKTDDARGWAFYELDKIRPESGGASSAERDALRLFAVLLAHWDNKPENQRLVCRPGADAPDGSCTASLAFIQDLGATFGPWKVDLGAWRAARIWADEATCRLSLQAMPFHGGTFLDATIGEPGRRLLGDLLGRLTPAQERDLFLGAHFPEYTFHTPEARDVAAWVAALEDKIRQIRDRPPCP